MKKSEVYSWRVSPQIKGALEDAARAENESVAQLLERIVNAWLRQQKENADDAKAQRQIREEAVKYIGSIKGCDPLRAQQASQKVKAILKEKHARHRSD